ncbi:MAG TPA: hypothetical protein VNO21_02740 [Polyangiaceae bacterium]|nr:hypothetical protein [Polyangiaceae bacterium]
MGEHTSIGVGSAHGIFASAFEQALRRMLADYGKNGIQQKLEIMDAKKATTPPSEGASL